LNQNRSITMGFGRFFVVSTPAVTLSAGSASVTTSARRTPSGAHA
jgi:hypothetical protein